MTEERKGTAADRKDKGWKTSEHFMTWAGNTFGGLMAAGFICADQGGACGQSQTPWCRVLGFLLIVFGQSAYVINRTKLKKAGLSLRRPGE